MNLGRLLDNRTPLVARCVALDDPTGREQLVTVAKLTWAVSPQGVVRLADPPSPLRFVPVTHDEATVGAAPDAPRSLRYVDDLVQRRVGTDVVMIGTARPPSSGKRVTALDVVLRVGDERAIFIDKTVRVYGPRVWQKGLVGIAPGPPTALAPTPLVYENAFGGRDDSDPARPLEEPRNPLGRGIALDPERLVGQPAPALEDPQHPLSSRKPAPACFGPIPSHWAPLVAHGGTYDESWRRERAPVRPLDFDPRFDGCAPDDQHCARPLRGDEMYEIHGVLPDRVWRFRLPRYRPSFSAKRRDRAEPEALETHLDTVLIDADEGRIELTWRASVPLPVVPQLMEWVRVGSHDALPEEVRAEVVTRARAALASTPPGTSAEPGT